MGTSETYGLYEDEKNEWPAQLHRMFENAENIEVFNAARVGLGFSSYMPYINKYVSLFEPDFMILFVNPLQYASTQEKLKKEQFKRGNSKDAENHMWQKTMPSYASINQVNFFQMGPGPFVDNIRFIEKIKQTVKQLIPEKVLKKYQYSMTLKQINDLEVKFLNEKRPLDRVPL